MSFRLIPNSVTLDNLEFMQESIVFLVRVQCRRKESSRSLTHLLMSFLLYHTKEHLAQFSKRKNG